MCMTIAYATLGRQPACCPVCGLSRATANEWARSRTAPETGDNRSNRSLSALSTAGMGVQISQPVGETMVLRGIETYGGTGDSLVKGVVVKLPAVALSIKPGSGARRKHTVDLPPPNSC